MKLGISYNLFDGEELLESSIKSVRNEAFHINVVYQTTSYYGNKTENNVEKLLLKLKEKGLIDEIYYYDKDFSKTQKHYYEREKRDIGLKIAKEFGCTHFLSMDVDEFYEETQLRFAKQFIEQNKIKTSAVSILEYLKHPQYRFVNSYTFTPQDNYNFYVPFIMKINKILPQKHSGKFYPCVVDPSRSLNNKQKFYLFSKQDIVMHHMSTVRKNLHKKYANSNLNLGDEKILKEIQEIKEDVLNWDFENNRLGNSNYSIFRKKLIEKVDNKFNINID